MTATNEQEPNAIDTHEVN